MIRLYTAFIAALLALATITGNANAQSGKLISERDAAIAAAKVTGESPNAYSEIYLIVQGYTGSCGHIRTPHWYVISSGKQVFVDARTGKVRDCRL